MREHLPIEGVAELGKLRKELDLLHSARSAMIKASLNVDAVESRIRALINTTVTVHITCLVCQHQKVDLPLLVGDPRRTWPRSALCSSCSPDSEIVIV